MLPRLRNKSLLDEFFNTSFYPSLFDDEVRYDTPAVNIVEEKDNFIIDVAAPGLDKKDFHIDLDNYVLTVSSKKEEKKEEKNDRFTMREFNYSSFSRAFTLPKSVNAEKIKASHKDGILKITIPKKEEHIEKPKKQIAIS
ncbi:MAG: Hsp20/alpha crystallin family protein [Chlorobi bacterium]|nr:Hsp20/alpha crystallin family protein [Chlorobiota bacterium]